MLGRPSWLIKKILKKEKEKKKEEKNGVGWWGVEYINEKTT